MYYKQVRVISLTFTLFCLIFSTLTQAAEEKKWQDINQLKKLVEQYIRSQTRDIKADIQVGPVNIPNIKLGACASPEVSTANQSRPWGRSSVYIRCHYPAWNISASTEVKVFAPVVMASHSLPPGTIIQANDLKMEKVELTRLPTLDILLNPQDALHQKAKVGIREGQILQSNWLIAPPIIKTGQKIQLMIKTGDFMISHEGQAMQDAAINQKIKVKVPSGQVVEGIVVSDTVVSVAY